MIHVTLKYWIRHLTFFPTSAYFVNGNTQLMSVQTANQFYPSNIQYRTNMVVYALEQCWEILRHQFENHGNVAECMQKLRTNFGKRKIPSAPYVRYLVEKVKETGILINKPKRVKPKTVRTPKIIAAVAESVYETPSTSMHRRSQELYISETSLRRILHKDLGHTKFNWFRS